MNKITSIIIILVALLGGVYLYQRGKTVESPIACSADAKICPDGSSVGRVGPSCEFAECPTVEKAKNLSLDLYPFYDAMEWSEEASSTIALRDQKFSGSEVSSKPLENISDFDSVFVPFRNYYQDKLTKAGWVQNKNLAYDITGSSLWVYTKGTQHVVFSYKADPINKALTSPLTCPCNVVFTIFSGTVAK